jgi:hypothetical protein
LPFTTILTGAIVFVNDHRAFTPHVAERRRAVWAVGLGRRAPLDDLMAASPAEQGRTLRAVALDRRSTLDDLMATAALEQRHLQPCGARAGAAKSRSPPHPRFQYTAGSGPPEPL